jgi:hypothetical protein
MIKWSGGFVYLDLSFLIEKVSFTETENGKKIDNIVMFCMVVSFFFEVAELVVREKISLIH